MAKKKSAPVELEDERGTTSISVRLENDLLAWIDEQAKIENRSRGNWIDTLLKQERARREPLAGVVRNGVDIQMPPTKPITEGRRFR